MLVIGSGATVNSFLIFAIVLILFIIFFGIVVIGLFEPVVSQYLWYRQPFPWIQFYHAFDYGLRVFTQVSWETELPFQNQLMEVFQVLGLERHGATQHSEEKHTQRPNIHEEAFITLVYNDLRC